MVLIWPMPMFILGFAQGSPPPKKKHNSLQMTHMNPNGGRTAGKISNHHHQIWMSHHFSQQNTVFYGYCMAIVLFFYGFLHFHPCPRALKKRPPPRCTKGQRLVQYRAILGTSCVVVTCFIPSGLLSNKTMYMYNMHIYIHTYISDHIRVNYNNSLTWIVRPFGDDFPY